MAIAIDIPLGGDETRAVVSTVSSVAPTGIRTIVDETNSGGKLQALLAIRAALQYVEETTWPLNSGTLSLASLLLGGSSLTFSGDALTSRS